VIKITATQMEDAWMETCLISISKIGGSELAAQGLTETVDLDIADKDIESVPLVNGGRVTKWQPQGDSSITFEAYPVETGTDTGSVLKGWDDLMNAVDSSVPLRILNTRTRNKYRVVIMWTNDTAATTAVTATLANASALRIGGADGYFTSVKKSFTDGVLKYTCIYKWAPFDKAANACILHESAAGTAAGDILPVIAAYTTANKFG
jgi:hypothetical protein